MKRTQGNRPAIAQTLFLLTVATLMGAPAAADGPTPRGKPVQIAVDVFDGNTPSGIFLNYPVTALTDDGSGAAAWVSEAWDNTASNIYFNRLDTKGEPLGAPSLVNCPVSEEGSYSGNERPAVATDAAGNSVVVWFAFTESSTAVKARLFAADGTPRGNEFCVDPNCSEPTPYSYSVAMAADGRFVVAFETPFNTVSRRFAADGTPLDAQPVPISASVDSVPAVAVNRATGDYLIAWPQHLMGPGGKTGRVARAVEAQRFKADGTLDGGKTVVTSCTASQHCEIALGPVVTSDGGNNPTFIWAEMDTSTSTGTQTVYARRYDHQGRALGSKFTVGNDPQALRAAENASGDIIVAFDGTMAQAVRADNRLLGAPFPITPDTLYSLAANPASRVFTATSLH